MSNGKFRFAAYDRINMEKSKKTIIVHIFKILYCYTSAENPVTQIHITEYLKDIGIICDRKTVGRNIKYLQGMNLPIFKTYGTPAGYYYDKTKDTFLKVYDTSQKK